MNKQQILEFAKQDPNFSRAVLTLENQIGDMPVTPEGLAKLVQLLEMAVNHLDKWPQIREAAIKDGMMDADTLPEQVDQITLMTILVVLYGLQERQKGKQEFAKGGLARARAKGRHGDTILAHISPREAAMLKANGGSGTINPETGLPEYFGLGDLFKAAVIVGLSYVSAGTLTPYLVSAGMGSVAAGITAGALTGAAGSALTGGDWKQGATMGALGGGLGSMAGQGVSEALGSTGMISEPLSAGMQQVVGSGLVGGAYGAATGKGFAQGAAQGAIGGYLGNQIGAAGVGTEYAGAIQAGGQQFGNAMAAGYDPKTAAMMGGLTGLATGISGKNPFEKPSEAVVAGMNGESARTMIANGDASPASIGATDSTIDPSAGLSADQFTAKAAGTAAAAKPAGGLGSLLTGKNALLAATVLSSLQGAPQEAQAAVKTMSPAQQELFNRPNVAWDWRRMQQDAASSGLSLGQFMSQNWPRLTGYQQNGGAQAGAYNLPEQPRSQPVTPPTKLAIGGLAALAQGGGSGRDDTIDARLSDGEYVFDAEAVAMLGDGSNEEGARRLDQMRSAIRAHKGKTLAKGKISPNAKSPLAYLKGVR